MTLFVQLLAGFGILLFLYFQVLRDKVQRRRRPFGTIAMYRSPLRPSVTRSEWRRGIY